MFGKKSPMPQKRIDSLIGAGTVVDGNPEKLTDVTDVWTFARDISSRDPNWKLVGTESGQ